MTKRNDPAPFEPEARVRFRHDCPFPSRREKVGTVQNCKRAPAGNWRVFVVLDEYKSAEPCEADPDHLQPEPVGPFTVWARPGKDEDEKPFEKWDTFMDLDVAIEMAIEHCRVNRCCEFRVHDGTGQVVQHEATY